MRRLAFRCVLRACGRGFGHARQLRHVDTLSWTTITHGFGGLFLVFELFAIPGHVGKVFLRSQSSSVSELQTGS